MYKCNVPACVPSKHGAVDCAAEQVKRFKARNHMDMKGFDQCNEVTPKVVTEKKKKKSWF
jgi:hypothetical protein